MIAIPQSLARIPLLRGVARLALSGWANLFHGRYLIERRLGLTLLLDRSNAVDGQLHLSGAWEPASVARLFELAEAERRHWPGTAVFLDVGAHWGLYALLAYRTGHYERVIALEPDPANYAQLQANLFLNDASGAIEALKLAASEHEQTYGLEVDSRDRGSARLVEDPAGGATCLARPLDKVLDLVGKLLVVKVDVETHEEQAIAGMLSLLARNHCVLQVEIWTGAQARDPDRPRRMIERLARLGLRHVGTLDSDYFFVSERRDK
jgi:FkbM family methyltransferase